jgi:nicotinamidase-related amidase
MTQALIIIDYTNDFVANDGALTAGQPAIALEDRIVELANEFNQRGDYVILPTDLHTADDPFHPETKLFPPHNEANTWGREYFGKLQTWVNEHQADKLTYIFPKNRYSSFANTNLDNFLRERGITEIHLVGVVTDICVLHTAVDAYNLNYDVTVHPSGVASFNQAGHEWALDHFKNTLGFKVAD